MTAKEFCDITAVEDNWKTFCYNAVLKRPFDPMKMTATELQEAIEDAKQVREIALKNAKQELVDAFEEKMIYKVIINLPFTIHSEEEVDIVRDALSKVLPFGGETYCFMEKDLGTDMPNKACGLVKDLTMDEIDNKIVATVKWLGSPNGQKVLAHMISGGEIVLALHGKFRFDKNVGNIVGVEFSEIGVEIKNK